MIIEYALIAVVLAFIRKGSIKRLSETEIKLWYLIVASFLIQLVAIYFYSKSNFFQDTYPLWIIGSYLILMYGIWYNHRLPGFKIFGLGTTFNFLVIAANGGRMPISPKTLEMAGESSKIPIVMEGVEKHQLLTETTHLPYLADVILLTPPFVYKAMIISAGDIVITMGVSWFFYRSMVHQR